MRTLLSSAQMAAADAYTIQAQKVPGIALMERAAMACSHQIMAMLASNRSVAVVVGCGNNGGDGLAIARLLLEQDYLVESFLAMPDKPFRGDAAHNFDRLKQMGGIIQPVDQLSFENGRFSLLVDALFGTGLNRALDGSLQELIIKINAAQLPVLAVDIPSGLLGDSGCLAGEAIVAQRTVTFQFMQPAHVITPASGLCGDVHLVDIGIQIPPGETHQQWVLDATDFHRPARDHMTHKGSFGSLAVLGGFTGMEGAANLAAVAALRFGVGKVRVFSNHHNGSHHDSVMTDHISQYVPGYNALVIGPGLSRTTVAFDHLRRLNLEKERVLWDADGLYYLKHQQPSSMGKEWVMTPHPGEAAALLNCLPQEIQVDRLNALERLSKQYPGGWILLKGNHTLVRSPEGLTYVLSTGTPALAVAGSGDVLSGMIGSLMAQGHPLKESVLMASLRHGIAGDRWSAQRPDYSMLAEDIIDDLKEFHD